MVQVPVHSIEGEVVDHIELNEAVFGIPVDQAVVHQAMVRQLANAPSRGRLAARPGARFPAEAGSLSARRALAFARRGSRRAPYFKRGWCGFRASPQKLSPGYA